MTCNELLYYYCEQIECGCPDYFALCRRELTAPDSSEILDLWLPPSKSLADLGIEDETHLYIKVKFFKSPSYELDSVALDLFYMQLKVDILSGQHLVSDSVALLLAAIQLQINRGNFVAESELLAATSELNLNDLMPVDHRKGSSNEQWIRRICRIYRRLYGLSSSDAKWCFLQVARQIPTCVALSSLADEPLTRILFSFGASFFTVTQGTLRVTLAVVEDGILTFKESDRTSADYSCFLDIVDWSPTRSAFGLTIRIIKPRDTDASNPDAIEMRP